MRILQLNERAGAMRRTAIHCSLYRGDRGVREASSDSAVHCGPIECSDRVLVETDIVPLYYIVEIGEESIARHRSEQPQWPAT